MLLSVADQLWKGGQEPLDTYPRHVYKLARDQGCRARHRISYLLERSRNCTVWYRFKILRRVGVRVSSRKAALFGTILSKID